jgi:hypothetical protein
MMCSIRTPRDDAKEAQVFGMASIGTFHRLFIASAVATCACAAFTVERAVEAETAEAHFQTLRQRVLDGRTAEVTEAQLSDTVSDGLARYHERDAGLFALCGLVPLTAVGWILRRRERLDRVIADF